MQRAELIERGIMATIAGAAVESKLRVSMQKPGGSQVIVNEFDLVINDAITDPLRVSSDSFECSISIYGATINQNRCDVYANKFPTPDGRIGAWVQITAPDGTWLELYAR